MRFHEVLETMKRTLMGLFLASCLQSTPAFADEPAELSTTNGLLLSIFVGFGTGHFYAKEKGAGAAFLLSQAGCFAGGLALHGSVNKRAINQDFSEDDLNRYLAATYSLYAVATVSRILEVTTVIPAVERYNSGESGVGEVTLRKRGHSERASVRDPEEARLDDEYLGDSAYVGVESGLSPEPREPPSPEEARSKAAWKLATLIYNKLGRDPDEERQEVYILILGLIEDGYVPSTILASIDTGVDRVSDPGTASVCAIIRAGIE